MRTLIPHGLLLALAATLLAPAAAALPVSFSNGSSLTVVGGYAQTTPLVAQFGITNTGSSELTLGVHRQIRAEVRGSENNFCFGVSCYPPNVSVAPQPIILAGGGTDNSFIGDYLTHGQAGVSRIRYAFYDVNGTGRATDTAYVTVTYDASQRVTGRAKDLAAATLLSAPAPNPVLAGADVFLALTASDPRAVTLRLVDLRDGRTVRTVGLLQGWCGTPAPAGFTPVSTGTAGTSSGGTRGSGPRGDGNGGCGSNDGDDTDSPAAPSPAIAPGGCYLPGGAPTTRTVHFSTAGLAAGVYGCLVVDGQGRAHAMRRLVVQ
ncbi:MAG: hypothetical protein H7330_07585 [Hymenobacteraceae bacterium]|nr:hypothetical protein [Hymenobacteraceae bacterium]